MPSIAMMWIVFLLCITVILHIVTHSTDVPECFNVKAFAMNELTRRCLVRFKRTPESSSYSLVSGRTIDELQAHAQCSMPAFVRTGCWASHS